MADVYNIIPQLEHKAGQAVTAFVLDNQDDIQSSDEEIIEYVRVRWTEENPGLPLPFETDYDDNPLPPPPLQSKQTRKSKGSRKSKGVKGSKGSRKSKAAKADKVEAAKDPDQAPSTQHVPDVLLSESERVLQSMIEASTEYPDIDVGEMLERRSLLAIPKGLAKPEYTYKWVDLEEAKSQVTLYGGQWMPVNHTNHPDYNPMIFGPTGGVTIKGQLMLCCMPRRIADVKKKQIIDEFALKADEVVESLNKRYHDPAGREVVVVERTKDPGEIGGEELVGENEYDYGSPADAGAL